jgi:very-short-patch-repair endonuclease
LPLWVENLCHQGRNWQSLAHRQLRFAVELDVYATHGAHEPFEEDRRRDEDLKLADVELGRVTGRRLEREPRRVVERIDRLLDQRRRQLGGTGWGGRR